MDRHAHLQRLRSEEFDLLVVGGGITGTGVAFDAACRGMRVALVERGDFASGTSSKSSKLVHGGLRYLQHLEVGLVREALTERGVLLRMAPHLVRPTPFVIPRYGKRRLLAVRVGLDVYDLLAIGSGYPRHKRLDPDDVLRMAPALRPDPAGGLVYWDARTDDTRLTWTVARSAAERGAAVVNHAEVVGLLRSGPVVSGQGPTGSVAGAEVADRETGEAFEVRARTVVNATGVWSDSIQRMETPGHLDQVRPSKGSHLVFAAEAIPVHTALLVPTPDGRYVFVIPFGDDRVIVGTTDEDYPGDVDAPRAQADEVAYLLGVLNRVLALPLSPDDVIASFAGLRPLIQKPGGSTKDLSRRHKVAAGAHGLITITGGKLTTWRPMAADAVDAALEVGAFKQRPSSTTQDEILVGGALPPGAEETIAARATNLGLSTRQAQRLFERYGSTASDVLDAVADDPSLGELLHPDLQAIRAEAAYAITHEAARTPDDVLDRRTRLRILTRDRGEAALGWVADRLAAAHGWDDERRRREIDSYRTAVAADRASERG